jgi:beta-galactosidase GanA
MKNQATSVILPLVMTLVLAPPALASGATPIETRSLPHLQRQGSATQLIVDGKPFLVLGGELGNSSSSTVEYLGPIWPKLVALKLNTLLAPVYWDLCEPEESRFDFALVDSLIQEARRHQLRLVLLWFGSWKNSMSCYAPAWVKTDLTRFPRTQDRTGGGQEMLSPFSEDNRDADARAFVALMRHLREIDGAEHTVIMIQVENEIGMIPEARDRGAIADRLFHQSVPPALLDYLERNRDALAPELRAAWATTGFRKSGTWEEVFGPGPATEERFMAWHYARYVEHITELGKSVYPLPMYLNAALIRPNYLPGQYPSAGPLPHLLDIWRAGAPQIDFLSPDIYFPNLAEWCRRYQQSGNPLFIPEALRSPDAAANAFYVFGQHDAIGFCPFGIESIGEPAGAALARAYELLGQLTPIITEHQGKGEMAGLLPESAEQRQPQKVRLAGYILNVSYERLAPPALADGVIIPGGAMSTAGSPNVAGGLAIAIGPDEFLFAGTGITVTFETQAPGEATVGILSIQEGRYVDGRWLTHCWMNGDQSHQGRHLRLPPGEFGIQRIKLYRYR